MTDQEKYLLKLLQSGFPIAERPFAQLAEQTGMDEDQVLALVRQWVEAGLIRRIGPVFSPAALGWESTLCAARVPPASLEDFVARVNALPGVTHNYLRDHPVNVWFTLIAPDRQALTEIIETIQRDTGVAIIRLPARKVFKLKAEF